MASLVLNGNTSGSVTISSPAVSGTTTLTLPTTSGTVMVNGPAFSAYANANQSVTSGVLTKINLNTETFDTNNNFDTSTYRFTPTVSGYYQINGVFQSQATNMSAMVLNIYKNGSSYKSQTSNLTGTPAFFSMSISDVVYLNGSTDYIELYGQINASSSLIISGGSLYTYMSGVLVRSA